MKKIEIDEIRKIQLEMLDEFDKFCNKHGLRYFLDAGTLLGAVRHNGFIPWDDDIDIGMPRADYDRLIDLAQNGYGNSVLIFPQNSIYSYLKIMDKRTILYENVGNFENKIGVYIDVFPKDGIKKVNIYSRFQCYIVDKLVKLHWFLKSTRYRWRNSNNIIKKNIGRIGFLIKDDLFALKLVWKISKRYKFDEVDFVATIQAGGLKNVVSRKELSSYMKYKFEHLYLNIPVGYDTYLRKLYGDYMQLPSLDKRVRHHNYRAYMVRER